MYKYIQIHITHLKWYLEGALVAVAVKALDHLAIDAEPQHCGGDLVVLRDGVRPHCQRPTGRPCK